jgi:hypothetical protein
MSAANQEDGRAMPARLYDRIVFALSVLAVLAGIALTVFTI